MPTIERVSQVTKEEIPLFHSSRTIDRLTDPLSGEAERHLNAQIEAEGEEAADQIELAAVKHHAEAVADAHHAERLHEQAAKLRQTAEAALASIEPGDWKRAVIYLACAAACFFAELAFTLMTLPFLLNIPANSFLGVAVAIAPTTALVVLDLVFARLFENPWERMRSKTAGSRLQRFMAVALMAMFLTAIAALNLQTIKLLAEAREEAGEIARQDFDAEDAEAPKMEINHELIREAVIAISITVAADGALLLLLGLIELNRSRRHTNARKEVEQRRTEEAALHADWRHRTEQINVRLFALEQTRAGKQAAAAEYISQMKARLKQKKDQLRSSRSALTLVENILSGRAEAEDAGKMELAA